MQSRETWSVEAAGSFERTGNPHANPCNDCSEASSPQNGFLQPTTWDLEWSDVLLMVVGWGILGWGHVIVTSPAVPCHPPWHSQTVVESIQSYLTQVGLSLRCVYGSTVEIWTCVTRISCYSYDGESGLEARSGCVESTSLVSCHCHYSHMHVTPLSRTLEMSPLPVG